MVADIWDKKPKSVEVAEEYADNYYHAPEMDAWLEKLKTHYICPSRRRPTLCCVSGRPRRS